MTRERISRILEMREIFLSFQKTKNKGTATPVSPETAQPEEEDKVQVKGSATRSTHYIKTALISSFRKKKISYLFIYLFLLNTFVLPLGFVPWEIQVVFPGESQLRQTILF